MNNKIRVGISSCLLGEKVRYDGQHKLDRYLRDTLGRFIEWYPVCAETECGMPCPREAMNLYGMLDNPQLITVNTGQNLTKQMNDWITVKLREIKANDLSGFVLKKKSPSCALYDAKIYDKNNIPYSKVSGLFAKALSVNFPLIPLEDGSKLHNPAIRDNFIESIIVYSRWQEMIKQPLQKNSLEIFHQKHKLIIMAHAPSSTAELGKIASSENKADDKSRKYICNLMKVLKIRKSIPKNVNVLQHIFGYFKKDFTQWEKEELIEIINEYEKGLIPIIVPLTLFRHYIKKYDKKYLQSQYYIYRHRAEL